MYHKVIKRTHWQWMPFLLINKSLVVDQYFNLFSFLSKMNLSMSVYQDIDQKGSLWAWTNFCFMPKPKQNVKFIFIQLLQGFVNTLDFIIVDFKPLCYLGEVISILFQIVVKKKGATYWKRYIIITTKGVPICQVISLDFEWIH